jgi:hypothetical protein
MSDEKSNTPYTAEQAVIDLTALHNAGDPERGHGDADDILCCLLEALGYRDVVDAYQKVEKWRA